MDWLIQYLIEIISLRWRAPKTATSATPVAAVMWPRSRFNTSGPDPLGFTGRAWLQAGAQQAVIAVDPSFNSLGIDSRNVTVDTFCGARKYSVIYHFRLSRHLALGRRAKILTRWGKFIQSLLFEVKTKWLPSCRWRIFNTYWSSHFCHIHRISVLKNDMARCDLFSRHLLLFNLDIRILKFCRNT